MWSRKYELKETLIGRLPHNGDLLEELNAFCIEKDVRTGWISLIGAVKKIKLGFYNQQEQKYILSDEKNAQNDRPLEIASCTGNISIKEGKPFVHLHIVVSDEEDKAFGGHVMPGTIIFAGEFMIHSFEGEELVREFDAETGLPLWKK